MKATALIAAAALMCGTAAIAQTTHDSASRGEENARVEQQDHGTAGQKLRNAMHKLGEKTRHAFHRVGDAAHRVAHRDHASDTHAMGASGTSHDADASRQARMDDAYAHWYAKQEKQDKNR